MNSREGHSVSLYPPKTRLKSLWTAFVVPTPPSRRVFLLILSGVLLPLVTVLVFSYREVSQHVTDATLARRAAMVQLAETSVEEKLDKFILLSESYASRPGLVDAVSAGEWNIGVDVYLAQTIETVPEVNRILLVNPEGVLMSDWPRVPEVIGQNFSFRDWYQGVSRTQDSYVSGIYQRTAEPQLNVISVATPLRELSGEQKILGYLVLQIKADTFLSWSEEIDAGPGSAIYLVDQYGKIVAHPKYDPQGSIIDYSSVETVRKLMEKMSGEEIVYNPIEGVSELVAYEHIPTYNWGVVVAQSTDQAFAGRDDILGDLVVIYGIVTGLGALFAIMALWLFARMRSYAFATAQEMNKSLTERQAQLTEAEELAKLGSWKWDLEKKVVTCSSEMYKLFGLEGERIADPVETCSLLALGKDQSKVRQAYVQTVKNGRAFVVFQIRRKNDGRVRWVRWQARAKYSSDGAVTEVAGVVQDITLEKELEEAKSEFVTLAAHQLRTPLSIINWMSEILLEDKKQPLASKHRPYVRDILLTNKRLVKLVNTLLNISRIEMGTFSLRLEMVSLKKISTSVIEEYARPIKEKQIKVETKFDGGADTVWGDENLLSIILSNLISNAVSYTPPKGKISIRFFKGNGKLHITVKDTGMGIPSDVQDKVFNKFFRASNAKIAKPEGTGLGLFMVKTLVEEQVNGKVWFESTEGEGSEFHVSLPLTQEKKRR